MKKSFLVATHLLLFLIAAFLLPQSRLAFARTSQDTAYVDAAGKRQGYWKITREMVNGQNRTDPEKWNQVLREGKYKDSYMVGLWIEYHEDGTRTEWIYSEKNDTAHAKRFRNSALIAETHYINNVREGIAKLYYRGGTVLAEFTWKNGRLDGSAKTYWDDGRLCEEGIWKYNYWAEKPRYHHRLR